METYQFSIEGVAYAAYSQALEDRNEVSSETSWLVVSMPSDSSWASAMFSCPKDNIDALKNIAADYFNNRKGRIG